MMLLRHPDKICETVKYCTLLSSSLVYNKKLLNTGFTDNNYFQIKTTRTDEDVMQWRPRERRDRAADPPAAPRILSQINHGNFTPVWSAMPNFDELISQLRMFQINLQTISPVQPNSIIDFWYYFYFLLSKPRAIQTTSSRTDRKHLWLI